MKIEGHYDERADIAWLRFGPPPEGDDSSGQLVPLVGVIVGDEQPSSADQPVGGAGVTPAPRVADEDGFLDVRAGDARSSDGRARGRPRR